MQKTINRLFLKEGTKQEIYYKPETSLKQRLLQTGHTYPYCFFNGYAIAEILSCKGFQRSE